MSDAGVIVIGSGPAGIGAAEAFREREPDAPLQVLTADSRPPYQRPPLSKDYLRGQTDEVAMDISTSFQTVLNTPVQHIDVHNRVVTTRDRRYSYRALIIASGAGPVPLPVPGGEQALLLRSFDDARRLREAAGSADAAVVIGAGFIGCEAAASLALQGLSVSLVAPDHSPQQKRLGDEAGKRLLALVEATGVQYVGGVHVTSLRDGSVHLDDGTALQADLVLAATGVKPNVSLAETAGLPVQDSRIIVGSDMSTDIDGVYAAGDVAFALNAGVGRPLAIEHWQDAADQGEVAGARAAGDEATWSGVPGFWTTIGDTDVKYHAWGDGYQRSRLILRDNGFTVWYESGAAAVGVLTCNADDDYDQGEVLISAGKPPPVPMS